MHNCLKYDIFTQQKGNIMIMTPYTKNTVKT